MFVLLLLTLLSIGPCYYNQQSNLLYHQHHSQTYNKIPGNILSQGGVVSFDGSPYLVESDIVVPEHSTLFIEPGVEIRFSRGVGVDVYGTLLARGLPNKRIKLSSAQNPLYNSAPKLSNVRVSDGMNVSTGRLQIRYKGKWRTICAQPFNWTFLNQNPEYSSHRYWNQRDITTACKSFGYDNGTFDKWLRRQDEIDHVLLNSPACIGNEHDLSQCKNWAFAKTGKGICGEQDENYALGIICWNIPCFSECHTKHLNWRGIHFINATYSSNIISRPTSVHTIEGAQHSDQSNLGLGMFNPFFDGQNEKKINEGEDANNWQLNRSESYMEYIDIDNAGINRVGQRVPVIMAFVYPPSLKGITVTSSAYTAIHFADLKGSTTIRSANISFNEGDGINLQTKSFGNISIQDSNIRENIGRGIVYNSEPASSKQAIDFCARPNLGLNQVYPIVISGNQNSECVQVFETRSGVITIHFLKISYNGSIMKQTDINNLPYLEIRDGSEKYDKLITYIRLQDLLRPQSITSIGSKVWVRFANNQGTFKNRNISMTFMLWIINKKSHDIAITNTIVSKNGLQGIVVNGATNLIELSSSTISLNGHIAGLYVNKGSSNIKIYNSSFIENNGSGVKVSYSGGIQNITTSLFAKNKGPALSINILLPSQANNETYDEDREITRQIFSFKYQSLNKQQKCIIFDTAFYENEGTALYINRVGHIDMKKSLPATSKKWIHFNISYSVFSRNKYFGIDIAAQPYRGYYFNTTILIINNTFNDNLRPAIRIVKPNGIIATIGSNTFNNNTKGAIMLTSDDSESYLPSANLFIPNNGTLNIDISYNYFRGNSGNFVILAKLLNSRYHKTTIQYNHFINNVILNSYKNAPVRSQVNAVVLISSSNVIIERNHFSNPLSEIELGTRALDRSLIIKAPYNWFDNANKIDQLQIEEIDKKIFDNSVRYNLARIDVYPFLRTPNLNGPTSNVPSPKNFVRGNRIGGHLEDYVILRRDNSPYHIKEDILVTRTGKLQIEEGVELLFDNMIGAFVEGELYAVGGKTPSKNILFLQRQTSSLRGHSQEKREILSKDINALSIQSIPSRTDIIGMPPPITHGNIFDNMTTFLHLPFSTPTTVAPNVWENLIENEDNLLRKSRVKENKNLQLIRLVEDKILARESNIRLGIDNRLHIRINGTWGTICNKGWTQRNAILACRSMGKIYDRSGWNLKSSTPYSGRGINTNELPYPSRILMNEIKCEEYDDDLRECSHETEHEQSCTHENDVAISCMEPRWAGIRWGFFTRKSQIKRVVFKDAGTFDPDTGQLMSAVTFDLNIHHLQDVLITQNMFGGLSITFHHVLEPTIIEKSSFVSNGGNGFITRSPGIGVSSCHMEDNAWAGFKYDPYLSFLDMQDIFMWDGVTPFPDKTIIHMNNDAHFGTKHIPLTIEDNQEIYLYFKFDQNVYMKENKFSDGPLNFETILNLSTIENNIFTIQLFGSFPLQNTLNLSIVDYYGSYNHKFYLKEYLNKLPFVSVTHNLIVFFQDIFSFYGGKKINPYNFILLIKSVPRPYGKEYIPFISIQNSTFYRNSEGVSFILYDSDENTDIFTPFQDINLVPAYDSHTRHSNFTTLISGTEFQDNKVAAISLNSPFHNTKMHNVSSITLRCIWCRFSGNFKVFETNDLYSYDSNNIWNVIITKSDILDNYGGLFIYFPHLLENDIYNSHIMRHEYYHTLIISNNTIQNNRNFTLAIQGSYVNSSIVNNIFINNVASSPKDELSSGNDYLSLIQYEDSCKTIRINNNSFERNVADAIITISLSSNDGPLIYSPLNSNHNIGTIKYNYFRYNKPHGYSIEDIEVNDMDNYPSIYIVGIYGVQAVSINYNIFQSNSYKYFLIAGLQSQPNVIQKHITANKSLDKTIIDWKGIGSIMNAQYNYWDTSNSHEIRKRIYDFHQWNSFVEADWYPYLTIADIDNSPLSQGSLYPQQFNPDSLSLGGYVRKNCILLLHHTKRPYFVKYDITVAPGVTLTVGEGVRLEFAPNIGILIYGRLDVQGTKQNPVIFTKAKITKYKTSWKSASHVKSPSKKRRYIKDNIDSRHLSRRFFPFPALFTDDNNFNYFNFDSKFPINVRLSGGDSSSGPNEGFLEYFNGTLQQWIPYCDIFFNAVNAMIICHTLGFEVDDSYYFMGWRPDVDTFWINRIKYWPHPLDCHGNERNWRECHPRLVSISTRQQHTKCDGRRNHLFIRCRIKPVKLTNDEYQFWGNIRFMEYPNTKSISFSMFDLHSMKNKKEVFNILPYQTTINTKMPSYLGNLIIEMAGMLHGHKASAILMTNGAQADIEGITIQNCAWHGIGYFNPTGDIYLSSQNSPIIIKNNRGLGINIINLLDSKFTENKINSKNPFISESSLVRPIYLDPTLVGSASILDACAGRGPIKLSSAQHYPLLVGYVHGNKPKIRCFQYFVTSPQKTIGFRLLHSSFSSTETTSFYSNFIVLYNDYPFKIGNKIGELNSSNPNLLRLFQSPSNKLGIYMEMNSGNFLEQWIGEIINLPSSIYYKSTSHRLQSINIERNHLGAINLVSVGEVTPNIYLSKNRIIGNGFHSFNFSTPQPIISLNLQNAQSLTVINNYLADNKGHTFELQAHSDSNTYILTALLQNNIFFNNMYGSVLRFIGTSPIQSNQQVQIKQCLILDNFSPTYETIKIIQVLINITENLIQNNTAGNHILSVYGFRDIIPQSPQTIIGNFFYNNLVIDLPDNKYKSIMTKEYGRSQMNISSSESTLSTVFSGSSFQNYQYNYFFNPENDYEFVTNYKLSHDIWETPVMATNNWWGTNHRAAISGRIKDKEDDDKLIASISSPFMDINSSLLQGECPPGWSNFNKKICYIYIGGAMKFTESIKFCNDLGGTLPYHLSSTSAIKEFISSQQYSFSPQNYIWVQKQPSAYLEKYDKCYAMVYETIEEISCLQSLPFVCEITPIAGLFLMGWFEKPFNIILVLILFFASILIASALICWQCKSKQRKKESFVRRSSIRSSIKSTRSLNSNASIGFSQNANRRKPKMPDKRFYSMKSGQNAKFSSYDLYSVSTFTTLSEAGFKENEPSIINENNFLSIDDDIRSETGTNVAPDETNYPSYYEMNDNKITNEQEQLSNNISNSSCPSYKKISTQFNNYNTDDSQVIYENIRPSLNNTVEQYDNNSNQSCTLLLNQKSDTDNLKNSRENIQHDGHVQQIALEKSKKSYADIIYRPKKAALKSEKSNGNIYSQPFLNNDETDIGLSPITNTFGIVDSAYDSNESKEIFSNCKFSHNPNDNTFHISTHPKFQDLNSTISSHPLRSEYDYPSSYGSEKFQISDELYMLNDYTSSHHGTLNHPSTRSNTLSSGYQHTPDTSPTLSNMLDQNKISNNLILKESNETTVSHLDGCHEFVSPSHSKEVSNGKILESTLITEKIDFANLEEAKQGSNLRSLKISHTKALESDV